jgi:hypothetical protein
MAAISPLHQEKIMRKKLDIVDRYSKRSVLWAYHMAKKTGGGASRFGSHAMSLAMSCEVKWFWSAFMGYEKAGGNFYMDFGTLGHTGLSYHYGNQLENKPRWLLDNPNVDVSMEIDSKGEAKWLKQAKDMIAAYKNHYANDAWKPVHVEEEFTATVGELDPDGEDEPAIGPLEFTDIFGQKRSLQRPSLNEEVVSCRPDMVAFDGRSYVIVDHKVQGGGQKSNRDRLPIISEQYPDYRYMWQAMVYMTIMRRYLPVEYFYLNRIKRDVPFDFSRDRVELYQRPMRKIPGAIREAVRKRRNLMVKAALHPDKLVPHFGACSHCDFTRLCYTDTAEERNLRLQAEYVINGERFNIRTATSEAPDAEGSVEPVLVADPMNAIASDGVHNG